MARRKAAQSPENLEAMSPDEAKRLLHELLVHQIELEIQNEDLRRAQAELGASQARYFDLYDLAPVGYVTVSEKGLILEANLTAATLLGVTKSALVREPISRFIIKEDQDLYYRHRKQLFETHSASSGQAEEPQACELRMVKMDGTTFWAHLEATAVQAPSTSSGPASDGAPVCRVVLSDITERSRAEETLRESVLRYELVLEGATGGIWDWDVPNKRVHFSSRWKMLRGYADAEIGDSETEWSSGIHPDDAPRVMAATQAYLAGQTAIYEEEYRIHCKDGSWKWILDRGKAMHDATGRVVRMAGSEVDITKLKLVEEALRESREVLRAVLNAIPVRVFWKDRNLVFLGCNTSFARDAGFQKPEDLLGKDDYAMGWREHAEHYRNDDRAVIESGESRILFEEPQTTPSGEKLHLLTSKLPLRDARGDIIGVLGTYLDITKRKLAEEENTKLEAQLQQAQKMESVGRLAGGVAHDFNNMLGIILGHTELAIAQVDPAQPLFADLEQIRKAANRSADLTRQLLAFARKQTVAPRVLDLNETVESMLTMLARLIGEDIHLTWQPKANLWPLKVDPTQIDQILANLCVNARDSIPDVGKLTIETGNSTFGKDYCAAHAGFVPGEYVVLAVSDDGCGMDKETLTHIFEPFFTTKAIGKGTGLGLATVYGMVKQNNGFISVHSEPGQGTTFKIYLPRYVGEAAPVPQETSAEPAAHGHETILLVEDEPALLAMTTIILETQGYSVLTASTPGEAICLAGERAGEIHLLMTDVVMPEMNGLDLAKNLLSLHPHLKCLFMSGHTADVIAHHGVLNEGLCFIQKPFSMKELGAAVREALEGSKE
jgi:PAS domain S-box-containing protein